ncbi:MAG: bifunctional metallophosphatase/5'-nucleotidase, partial [Candidatus Nealsonbacteria bacterium]|nr:bifunctional metallophosphatase/5'-nucleotidase [Candidatus Nealsonbacteria bacterium]
MRLLSMPRFERGRPAARKCVAKARGRNRQIRFEPLEDRRMLSVSINPIGTYETGIYDEGAAEIVAHDPVTQRLFVVNGDATAIDVLDISDPTTPTAVDVLDVSPYGDAPTSVAVSDGLVAVSVKADPETNPGQVAFFTTAGDFVNSVEVGACPDMLTFTPDGAKVLVANEGQPSDDYTIDPEGSVSIVDVSGGASNATVTTADFTAFNGQVDELRAAGVRIFAPGASVAEDVEPEYIAVSS